MHRARTRSRPRAAARSRPCRVKCPCEVPHGRSPRRRSAPAGRRARRELPRETHRGPRSTPGCVSRSFARRGGFRSCRRASRGSRQDRARAGSRRRGAPAPRGRIRSAQNDGAGRYPLAVAETTAEIPYATTPNPRMNASPPGMRAPKSATRDLPVTTSSRKTPELRSSAPALAPAISAPMLPSSTRTDIPCPRFAIPPAVRDDPD